MTAQKIEGELKFFFRCLRRAYPVIRKTRLALEERERGYLKGATAIYVADKDLICLPYLAALKSLGRTSLAYFCMVLLHESRHVIQYKEGLFRLKENEALYETKGNYYRMVEIDADDWALDVFSRLFRRFFDEDEVQEAYWAFMEDRGDLLAGRAYGKLNLVVRAG
jgi:hypothetical protein